MVVHDSPFEFRILMRYESVGGKIRVIGIVFCYVIAAFSYTEKIESEWGLRAIYRIFGLKATSYGWVGQGCGESAP